MICKWIFNPRRVGRLMGEGRYVKAVRLGIVDRLVDVELRKPPSFQDIV